ncbi:hypothetical protein MMON_36480 [Mycolicibacterium monacense]|uniref:Mycofactocin n=2 Tax=Mycobacteriaceae TaxID=1762 RepID=A0AAD1N0T1_MYCMB|nr:hypothetical protein MMON_36480 [Mycolicibacterium monacense]
MVLGGGATAADPGRGILPHDNPPLPFWHSMPYPRRPRSHFSDPTRRKAVLMEPNQHVEADTELVTETLVEEVSIDGMCGVY